MSDELRTLAEAATPGPWAWLENKWREKHMVQTRNGNWRARPGHRADDTYAWYLAHTVPAIDEIYADEYDYKVVMALRWSQVKGKELWNTGPSKADAAYLAAVSPDVVLKLLAERDAGRALYEALVAELDPHEGLARDVYGVISEALEAYRKVVD